MMIPSEISTLDLSKYILFQIKRIFLIYKNKFLNKKIVSSFLYFFFEILINFIYFIYSGDYIGKITLKSIN